jgi:hypothetical protein
MQAARARDRERHLHARTATWIPWAGRACRGDTADEGRGRPHAHADNVRTTSAHAVAWRARASKPPITAAAGSKGTNGHITPTRTLSGPQRARWGGLDNARMQTIRTKHLYMLSRGARGRPSRRSPPRPARRGRTGTSRRPGHFPARSGRDGAVGTTPACGQSVRSICTCCRGARAGVQAADHRRSRLDRSGAASFPLTCPQRARQGRRAHTRQRKHVLTRHSMRKHRGRNHPTGVGARTAPRPLTWTRGGLSRAQPRHGGERTCMVPRARASSLL